MTHAALPAWRGPARPRRHAPLFASIAFAEWTKLRTLRSSYWTLLAAAIAMAAFGALLCAAYARHLTPASRAALDPAAYSQSGFFLAQLAVGVLGVLTMTGEYATGSIRSTLAAAPQRVTVLAAKAAVFTAVAFTAGLTASLAAFLLGQAIFAGQGIRMHLGDPGTLRPVVGAALYLAVFGLASLGLGALIRRTAGAIAILIAAVIFLPVAVGALPATWQDHLNPYLPSVAGQVIIGHTKFTPPGHLLSPWTGFAVFCGYTAAILIATAITLSRRDA
jgi:ABC-type transport system involved in multi-copper enzyme maturation permease subunit